jgi:GT2 family glycosyltransferase
LLRHHRGAFMLMERRVANELGGFDESYAIGDFEDSDLCLRLAQRGLASAVDLDVTMYHLERQSQAGSEQRWRQNLTLHNAWQHEGRWGEELRRPSAPPAEAAAPAPAEAGRRRRTRPARATAEVKEPV